MSILLAIVALGILILVHELGHFITAKLCGIWVERFSIGFGPVIWSKKHGDTEYALSAVPLGGYVKLHRMFAEEGEVEGKENQAFFNKPIPQKLLVITAGVLFNVIFAILLFSVIFMAGYKTYGPVIGTVAADSIAFEAGLQEGDRIVSVNGKAVRSWDEFLLELGANGAVSTKVTIERAGANQIIELTPAFIDYTNPITGEEQQFADIGADFVTPPVVGSVSSGFPAALAGIKKGDTILSIDEQKVTKWADIGLLARPRADMLTEVMVRRGEETLRIGITPQRNEKGDGILGVMMIEGDVLIRTNPAKAFVQGIERTGEVTWAIIAGIKQLVTGKVSKDNIGGPILIVQEGARSAEGGYERYLSYMALISINLAILNLLPIPVLDGGYVVMFIYEAIRRKKMGVKARERGQMVGMALLGLLMVFAFYNDIFRFLR